MNVYYVYVWRNPESNEIFYVGKGKNKRAWSPHSNCRCGYKLKSLIKRGNNIKDIVHIVKDGLTEITALEIENRLIKKYKRIEEGGTLLNYALNGARISSKEKKYIDPTILDNIKNLYEKQKFAAAYIGKIYNVTGTTILRWLRISGATIRFNSLPRSQIHQHIDKVVEMYASGTSAFEIGRYFNVDIVIVIKILRQRGINITGKRIIFSPAEIENIKNDYISGKSANTIAKKYNVSCSTILRALKENNICIRNKSDAQKSKKL